MPVEISHVIGGTGGSGGGGGGFVSLWDASGGTYPTTGISGGDIDAGNWWKISVAGTLGGVPIQVGDGLYALVDTPGQTDANWDWLDGAKNTDQMPEGVTNLYFTTARVLAAALAGGWAALTDRLPQAGDSISDAIARLTGMKLDKSMAAKTIYGNKTASVGNATALTMDEVKTLIAQAPLGNSGAQITGNYTVATGDVNRLLLINVAGATDITVPLDTLGAALESGCRILIPWASIGAGTITFVASGAGATLTPMGGSTVLTAGQGASGYILITSTTAGYVGGTTVDSSSGLSVAAFGGNNASTQRCFFGKVLGTSTSLYTAGGNFSAGAWVYVNSLGVSHPIFMHNSGAQSTYTTGISFHINTSNKLELIIQSKGTSSTSFTTGATSLTAGVWYHLAFSFENATLTGKVFINGVQDASSAGSTALYLAAETDRRLSTGSLQAPNASIDDAQLIGAIHDLRVFTNVQTAADFLGDYNAGRTFPANRTNETNRWKFNETFGAVANDSIGSHHLSYTKGAGTVFPWYTAA